MKERERETEKERERETEKEREREGKKEQEREESSANSSLHASHPSPRLLIKRQPFPPSSAPRHPPATMSQCRKRCRRQLTKVARFFYRFVTGTLTQGRTPLSIMSRHVSTAGVVAWPRGTPPPMMEP